MARCLLLFVLLTVVGCDSTRPVPRSSAAACESPGFPRWTFADAAVFPAGGVLARPEDGKSLPDSRLVVADEEHGLRVIDVDGSIRPFGALDRAGYSHNPPDLPGGANGVFLEQDGRHLLVTDIYTGALYRVDSETETSRLMYRHPFGINAVVRDSRGTIWFTQSAHNNAESGVLGMWSAVDAPVPTGGVFALRGAGDAVATEAEEVVSGMYFANGLAIDLAEEHLYVAELMMDRVLRFRVDLEAASVSDREAYASVLVPDNIAVDDQNNLWIASPVANQVVVMDSECRTVHTVFRAPSANNTAVRDAWVERSHLGQGRLELVTPTAADPLPGFLTGMFWSADRETVYFTGLGNAMLRLSMPQ